MTRPPMAGMRIAQAPRWFPAGEVNVEEKRWY
jgi:hypothetical protein